MRKEHTAFERPDGGRWEAAVRVPAERADGANVRLDPARLPLAVDADGMLRRGHGIGEPEEQRNRHRQQRGVQGEPCRLGS